MKTYDVIVVGSGSGAIIADEAIEMGLKVALVDRGPVGGTCLNVGCIPSKMLIYPADRIVDMQEAGKLGIDAEVRNIDFLSIMERMRKSTRKDSEEMRLGLKHESRLDFYETEGHFVSDYTMEVNGETIKANKVFLASGARPLIPPIKGLDSVPYLTNESVLQLKEKPESMIIIGGGYVAVEYAHFFAAMGTKVTIVEMGDRLAPSEEPQISQLLEKLLQKRMRVHTGIKASEINSSAGKVTVIGQDNTGKVVKFQAEKVMVAAGRKSNADILRVENTGVKVADNGFIPVNEAFETSKKGIFAIGDANGKYMFRHKANREAELAVRNVLLGEKNRVDYSVMPHAIYSHPQIASVGLTEEKARKEHDVLIGWASYFNVAKGQAMMETDGFAKAIVEKGSNRILGFHIIGPHAPELIQEVVNAMSSGGHRSEINWGIHIHPALSELIPTALNSLHQHA